MPVDWMVPAMSVEFGVFDHLDRNDVPLRDYYEQIVVADTDAHAMTIARRAYLRWRSSFTYLFELNGTLPDSPLRAESFDTLIGQGQAIAFVHSCLHRSMNAGPITSWGSFALAIWPLNRCYARSSCSQPRLCRRFGLRLRSRTDAD